MLQSFAVNADGWVPVIAAVISAASSLASLLNFPSVDDANMDVYAKYMVVNMDCVSILQLDPWILQIFYTGVREIDVEGR